MQQQTIDSLKTLKWLLDEGVLTAEEFEAQKRTILNNDEPKRMQPEPINMKPAPVAQPVTSIQSKNGQNALLLWAAIFVVTSLLRELLMRADVIDSFSPFFGALLLLSTASNLLPALAVQDKRYRMPCVLVVGLITLYYLFMNIVNMISDLQL